MDTKKNVAQETIEVMRQAVATAAELRAEWMIATATMLTQAAIAEQLAELNEHMSSLSVWANHTGGVN